MKIFVNYSISCEKKFKKINNIYVKNHIEKYGLEEALEGFAYCMDSNKKRSLNLYFNPNGFK